MNTLFGGKKKTVQEQAKECKKDIGRSTRELERDMKKIDRQEAELEKEIKKAAANGDMATARTLGKSLIQIREQRKKMLGTKAQMQSVSARTTTMAAQQKQMETFGVATSAMGAMNAQVDPLAMQKICQEFSMESQKAEMAADLMDDAFDGLDDIDIDEETAAVMNQVLDEVCLDINANARVGTTQLGLPQTVAAGAQKREQAL